MSSRSNSRFLTTDVLAVFVALTAALLVRLGVLQTIPW